MNLLNRFFHARSSKALGDTPLKSHDFDAAERIAVALFSRYGDGFATLNILREFLAHYGPKALLIVTTPQMAPYARFALPHARVMGINKRHPLHLWRAVHALRAFDAELGINPWCHGAESEYFISFAQRFAFYKVRRRHDFPTEENLYDKVRRYLALPCTPWRYAPAPLAEHYHQVLIAPESSDPEKSILAGNLERLVRATQRRFSPQRLTIASVKPPPAHWGLTHAPLGRHTRASEALLSTMQQTDLLISADSGPFHLAELLAKPSVVLFTKTAPEWVLNARSSATIVRAPQMHEHYCQHADGGHCRHHVCMDALFEGEGPFALPYTPSPTITRVERCVFGAN